MRWMILAVLVACGSESRDTVSPEPTTVAPEPPPPQAPPPLDDPEPEPVRFEIPASPDELPDVTELERGRRVLSRTSAWTTPQHPDPAVQRRLAITFEHLAYERAFTSNWGGDGSYWNDARPFGGCRPALATPNLVSVGCYRSSTHRGGHTTESLGSVVHLSIVSGQVIPFRIEEVFKPSTVLTDMVTEEACVESVMATGVRRMLATRGCRAMLPHPNLWMMAAKGFVDDTEGGAVLPYTLFREHLRADGPVAWLYRGESPQPWVSAEQATGFALTDVLPWPELVALATKLPNDALSEVRVLSRAPTGQLVLRGDNLERAREIATLVNGTVRRARWIDGEHELRRVRANKTLSLLTSVAAENSVRRVVPVGTQLIRIGDGEMVRVGSDVELVGWTSNESLSDDDSCRPDATPFLSAFDDEGAAQRLQVARTQVRMSNDADPVAVALFASTTGGRSRVRVMEINDTCTLGSTLLDEELRGHLFDLRLGSFNEAAGESFVLAGVYQGEENRRYFAYRMNSEANQRRVLADRLALEDYMDQESDPTSHVRTDGGDSEDWRPLVMGDVEYEWNGRMLIGRDR